VLFGGEGADFLNGGFGFDRLNGGAGSDRFYHAGVRGHGTDWVQDYQASENDVLVFAGDANAGDFHLAISTTPGAGSDTVAEVFVTHVPTLQILWALVDDAAQDTLVIRTDQGNFDLPLGATRSVFLLRDLILKRFDNFDIHFTFEGHDIVDKLIHSQPAPFGKLGVSCLNIHIRVLP